MVIQDDRDQTSVWVQDVDLATPLPGKMCDPRPGS